MEEEWGVDVEDETENRKKLDEDRKKLQKELREVEKLSYITKEVQENLKNDLQHQLHEVERRRHDIMPEHQKVQKRSQKLPSIQDKRKNMQKENAAAQEEMRKIKEENDRNEERFWQLSDKVDKNKMSDAEMAAELQRLQAGEERRGSNASQTGDCCWEALVEQRFVLGVDQARSKFCKKFEACVPSEQMSGKEEGRRNSGDGQEHGRASSWCYQRQPGSMKANQRVVWSLIFFVFGVHMVKAEEQENQGHWAIATEDHQTLQVDVQWKRIHSQETCECKGDERKFLG